MKADILHGNSSRNKPSCEPFEPGQSGGAANIELLRLLSSAQIEPSQRVSGVNARPRPVLIRMISDRSSLHKTHRPIPRLDWPQLHALFPAKRLPQLGQLMEHRVAGIIDQNKWYMDAAGQERGVQ